MWEFSIVGPGRGTIPLQTTGVASAYQLLSGTNGFGLPGYAHTLDESPAGGSMLRSSRVLSRDVLLRVEITGEDRGDVADKLDKLGWALSAPEAFVRATDGSDSFDLYVRWESGGATPYDDGGDRSLTVECDLVAPEGFWVASGDPAYVDSVESSGEWEVLLTKPESMLPLPVACLVDVGIEQTVTVTSTAVPDWWARFTVAPNPSDLTERLGRIQWLRNVGWRVCCRNG